MQTIHIDVTESKVDILLNIIKNLKEDVVEGYTITSEPVDTFFDERKQRLTQLREDVKLGKEPMYDFNTSTDSLVEDLKA